MKHNTQRMVVSAMLIALATVLSLIKVVKMPLGGAVTLLSMLPVVMLSVMFGARWGMVCSFLYSLLQLALDLGEVLSWGLTPAILAGVICFDYIFAFSVLGLAGILRKKGTIGITAVTAGCLTVRFLFHLVSGVIFLGAWTPDGWNNVWFYSMCYNGAYMLPELVFTTAAAAILFQLPQVKKLAGLH